MTQKFIRTTKKQIKQKINSTTTYNNITYKTLSTLYLCFKKCYNLYAT
ncbi:unnamed protein product [Paramecium sonneborni]|uniref:Uncharacterized protein n=1 Tax=Paramecium sonneborni TaxID=65129 RepID=A0A8S1NWF7_9CILI|nr:unnamed protein product [Paramecium sonneborni]